MILAVIVLKLFVRNAVSFSYEGIGPVSKRISFDPMDSTVYAGESQADQVMERSSREDVYYSQPKRNRKENQFNLLNFDAYLAKPLNFSYKKVFATLKPETERILKLMNRTITLDDEENQAGSKSRSGKFKLLHNITC